MAEQKKDKYYRLGVFMSNYADNFPKLLLTNLIASIPIVIFSVILVLVTHFTGVLNIYLAGLIIPIFSPFYAGIAYVTKKVSIKQKFQPVKDLVKGIRDNWRYSLINSLFVYVVAIGLWVTFSFYRDYMDNGVITFSFVMSLIFAVFFLLMQFSIITMMVSVELKFMQIVKNSVILVASGFVNHLKTIFSLLAVSCALFAIVQFSVVPIVALCVVGILVVTILPTFIIYIVVFNAYETVERYIIKPYAEEHQTAPEPQKDTTLDDLSYDELVALSKGNPNEYVSIGDKMLRRSTVAKLAEARKNKQE